LTINPNVKKLQKRNAFLPFEGREHIEFLGFKNDCSLFCFVSHNKKREHNIVLGRMFDFHILDMIEFGVVGKDRLDLSELRAMGADSAAAGGKPCFVFQGAEFNSDPFFVRLKNFFVDFFRGMAASTSEIVLTGVDRAIFVSLRSNNGAPVQAPDMQTHGSHKPLNQGNSVVCFRQYAITRPKTNPNTTSAAKLDLVDIGPNLDLEIRRCSLADDQQFKQACFLPKEALATIKSMHAGISHDNVGNLRGQLHVGSQDVQKGLALRKFKAHKRSNRAGEDDEGNEVEYNDRGQKIMAEAGEGDNMQTKKPVGGRKVKTGQRELKSRKVESSDDGDDTRGGKKRRHRPGQGKDATNDALSFVDM
jgi:ribosome production factor 2